MPQIAPETPTVDRLRVLAARGTTTDLLHAAPFFGVGANTAYALVKSGEWPTRVLRMGKKIRIPISDLAQVLGIDLDAPPGREVLALPGGQTSPIGGDAA